MPQERKDSENKNKDYHIQKIADFFNVAKEDVKKDSGQVRANFYYKGVKSNIVPTLIHLYEDPQNVSFNLMRFTKQDYSVGSYKVEVKQAGEILCETFSVDKNPDTQLLDLKETCEEKGLDSLEVNEAAIQNFIKYHGEEYIRQFLDTTDFKRTPDFILVNGKDMFSFEDFLKMYDIVCASKKSGGTDYSRIEFNFIKKEAVNE